MQQVLPADLCAYFFNSSRQAARPDAARPHGQALSAYFFVFAVHLFSSFSVFFSVFVVHFFFCALFWLLGAYFFQPFFCPSFLVLSAAERPSAPRIVLRSGRLHPREAAGESPQTRINRGFARVLYF